MRGVWRQAPRAALVALVAGATLALGAGPAAAERYDPPWYHGSGPGIWGAITLSDSSPPPAGDGKYGPITLQRHVPDGVDPTTVFSYTPPDAQGNRFWPETGSAGPFTFTRVTQCPASSATCSYYISGAVGMYKDLIFAAGDEPPTQPGGPTYFEQNFRQPVFRLSEPPPSTTTTTSPGRVVARVTFTPGSNGSAGTATFDATGSSAPGGETISSYRWTLRHGGSPDQSFTCTQPVCSPPASITLEPGVTYDVTLALLGANGSTLAASESAAQLAVPPSSGPAPGPGPSGGGGTTGAGGGASGGGTSSGGAGLVAGSRAPTRSTPLRRAVSSLVASGSNAPTVVWLWRPDFYSGSADSQAPKTSGPPKLKGKSSIVVSNVKDPTDTNAGPWLAGLGVFGLVGLGFLVNRRVQVLRARA